MRAPFDPNPYHKRRRGNETPPETGGRGVVVPVDVSSAAPDPNSAPAPSVSVLYFAALRDLAGVGEELVQLHAPASTVAALLGLLEQRHGGLQGRLTSIRVAVNEEFAELSQPLASGDVVALIPPVSGG
jgi:molybdopterin converting factor subunit 1